MADSKPPHVQMAHGYRRWLAVIWTRLYHRYRLRPLPTPSSVPCAPGRTRIPIRPSRFPPVSEPSPVESELLEPFLAAPERCAILMDVDGTLAPIVDRPEAAEVPA